MTPAPTTVIVVSPEELEALLDRKFAEMEARLEQLQMQLRPPAPPRTALGWREAAAYLGITRKDFKRAVQAGEIRPRPVLGPHNAKLYDLEELDRWRSTQTRAQREGQEAPR